MSNMSNMKTLDDLLPEEVGKVVQIKSNDRLKGRLLDLGITENTEIKCVGISPLGDPKAYLVRGSIFALRKKDAEDISVEITEEIGDTREVVLV